MVRKLSILVIVIFMMGAVASTSNHASDTERYFVTSALGPDFIPSEVDVRHDFGATISTEMTPAQARGIDRRSAFSVRPVPMAHPVSPPGSCSPWPSCKDDDDGDDDDSDDSDDEDDSESNVVSVNWENPEDGAAVADQVQLRIDASTSKSNIDTVNWKLEGDYREASYDNSLDLYTDSFDSSEYETGTYDLKAEAENKRGDSDSSEISVKIEEGDDTLPDVRWVEPENGEELEGKREILIDAEDEESSIESVEWRINSEEYRQTSVNSDGYYEDSWDTTVYSNEDYALETKAVDGAGNVNTASIDVSVNNTDSDTNTPPEVSFVNPKDGDTVSDTVNVEIEASDSDGSVESVEWRVNSEELKEATEDSSGVYTDTWDTTDYNDGDYRLQAVAEDDEGDSNEEEVQVTVENEEEEVSRDYYPSEQVPYGIKQIYGDDQISTPSGGSDVTVAVLDTGVDQDHLDLRGSIEQCKDLTGSGSCEDEDSHGTHVAGTISADAGPDGEGIYGVAPESNLYIYRVCSDGCHSDDVGAAIQEAAEDNADIVSISLGSQMSFLSDTIHSYDDQMLFVAAAGNDGPDLETINYPAAHPSVVSVAAIDSGESVISLSSRGVDEPEFREEDSYMEVAAAGSWVESSVPGGYSTKSGTSMAAPHVSGVAAKLWSEQSAELEDGEEVSPHEIRQQIRDLAGENDITSGEYAREGYDPAAGIGLPALQ